MPLRDVWELSIVAGFKGERTRYPTQKPESLLERIIVTTSSPGSLVLDAFAGSGTTVAVAQKLGRRWIGCDINKGAIQTTSKRLQGVVQEQLVDAGRRKPANQEELAIEESEAKAAPAQLSFTVWRVNDYDLQVQHNEAVNLACEHIGVQRVRSDAFFDGTLGKKLVKIVPFTHPLSPTDLEDLKRELEARPQEDREVVLVCLGIELAAKAWIERWNQYRRGANAANRVEVIELRTDEKYGGFIKHQPASARVSIERRDDKLHVEVQDFVSPAIIERLRRQSGIARPRIEDWRSMVDCILIDASYDGEVFDITLSDIPERKQDLVSGAYDLDVPDVETTVGVKVVDMLGEEVLVTADV